LWPELGWSRRRVASWVRRRHRRNSRLTAPRNRSAPACMTPTCADRGRFRFDGSNPKHPALPKSSAGTRSGPQLGRAIRPRATLSV
jgi:hypothetical protein